MSAVVFVGPTLPAGDVASVTTLPPARQGDLYRAVRDLSPTVIGLIDGVFLDVPAVWHREILWALDRGVHVFGAASMGALRAAELDGFGMVGIGRIYEAYRDGVWPGFDEPFEDDDEVAVVHAPPAAGGAALSDAMVDLRATLRAAVAAGVLDEAQCAFLARAMKALPFPDRGVAALARAAPLAVRDWIAANPVRQKAADARAMLAALPVRPATFSPGFRFARTLTWERFVAEQSRAAPSPVLTDMLERDPAGWRRLRRQALGRLAALADAEADDAAARAALDRFRHEHSLVRYEDIQAWLVQNDVDAAGLARLMHEEAALDAVPDPPGLHTAMLDLLRLSGGAR